MRNSLRVSGLPVSLALVLAICGCAHQRSRVTADSQQGTVARAKLAGEPGSLDRKIMFLVTNRGDKPFTIVRSMFPSRFRVTYAPFGRGGEKESWEIGILPSVPSFSGHDYVLVPPGESFAQTERILPYLKFPRGSRDALPGTYTVVFFYDRNPSGNEPKMPQWKQPPWHSLEFPPVELKITKK